MTPFGIVTGLGSEAARIRRAGGDPDWIRVAPGPAAAAAAARELIAAGAAGLVSMGVAGAVDPSLACADLLLIDQVAGSHQAQADGAWAARWHARLPHAHRGLLVGVNGVVADPAERALIRAETRTGLGVDTETAAMAAVAAEAGRPWLGLRAVVDTAADRLPRAAVAGFKPGKGVDLPALLAELARRPGEVPALIALGRKQGRALAALEAAARIVMAP